jgi:predicted TIM-barrel fold metal-dependent hydrolase
MAEDYRTDDGFVIDAVVHAYNFNDDNFRSDLARSFAGLSYGMVMTTGDQDRVSQDVYSSHDWSIDEIAEMTFVESDVDMAIYHGVPLDDYFFDGLSSNQKGIDMAQRWPDRVRWYTGVNPLDGKAALEQAEHHVKDLGAIGLKFYPERYTEGRGAEPVRFDGVMAAPFMEKAIELGVPVAVHKFVPAGQGVTDNYRIADVEACAARYPELQIEVVHSGMAFLEETIYMLVRYPNVWANLEVTTALAVLFKRRFAEAMGALMSSGAFDRLIFATGACLVHPQPVIDAMREFTVPDDLVEGFGFPQMTPEILEGIMGANFARLHGIDIAAVKAKIADDEFSRRRRELPGRPDRWSCVNAG